MANVLPVRSAAQSHRPQRLTRRPTRSVRFFTNITSPPDVSFAVPGNTSYDAALQVQRVDHAAGAYECAHFYGAAGPCSVFFTPKGMYAVTHSPARCCLDMPSIHAPPRSWLGNATFAGQEDVLGHACRRWDEIHSYWETTGPAGDSVPCKFSFPGHAMMDWYFDRDSYTLQRADPRIYALPSDMGDCSTPCSSSRWQ